MKLTILVVDDEAIQRHSLAGFLKKLGYQVVSAENGAQALKEVQKRAVDMVFTDVKMPHMDGYQLLEKIKELNPEIQVVIMTAYGEIHQAVQAMKKGAFDYLTKPIDLDEVEILIQRAVHLKHLIRENKTLKERLQQHHHFEDIITRSPIMQETLSLAARAADSKAAVLIQGESGTGKELIARAIHLASPRANQPLVTINCAAIPEHLLESELFGHEKGAFTGAVQQKKGLVEAAHGGTLFLDEIGDLPQPLQVKLLRFLQFGEFHRVGGTQSLKVDVRIIAATNQSLYQMVREGRFREDFYYRLNVITINIPPLRERKEDVPALVEHFIKKYATENNKPIQGISREALDLLMKYPFPGNVRELENIIEHAVVLCRSDIIESADLPSHIVSPLERAAGQSPVDFYQGSLKERLEAFEKDLIQDALRKNNYNQSAAARFLQTNERNIRYKMQKYGLKDH